MTATRRAARLPSGRRNRRRWPLTRQISLVFAAMMLMNAVAIIVVSTLWDNYITTREFAALSPRAQQTYDAVKAGRTPSESDVKLLTQELGPIEARLQQQSSAVLYGLVALAALTTFGAGYVVLGHMGKGLTNVAAAARNIARGDLAERAAPIYFASREEAQLITDFNLMAASLQRAERELAASTASIAHELRTPLTILRGRLHGFRDGVFAMDATGIDGLLFQVEGLGRLVDDLQTLSLATSGRLQLTLANTDLGAEVRRVLASVAPDLEAAGMVAVLDLAPAPLLADGARLRQVIAAVLANAIRYAPDSGALTLSTQMEADDALLEIVDRGPGLPGSASNIAFDRFWRGEESRGRHAGGSGLGLAVVRAIVEAHGGAATIANGSSGGTVFRMRLPSRG